MGGVPFWLRKQEFSSHGWLPFLFRKQRSRPKSGRELVFFLRVGGWVGSSSDVLRFRVGACYALLLLNLLLLLIHPLPSCSSSLAPSPATLLLQFGNSAATSNHSVSTLLLCLCVCLSLFAVSWIICYLEERMEDIIGKSLCLLKWKWWSSIAHCSEYRIVRTIMAHVCPLLVYSIFLPQ